MNECIMENVDDPRAHHICILMMSMAEAWAMANEVNIDDSGDVPHSYCPLNRVLLAMHFFYRFFFGFSLLHAHSLDFF